MTSALFVTLLAVAAQTPSTDETSVRVSVWPRTFVRYGEPVRVTVDARRDGFLMVLRVDTYGRVHVLYPFDPDDDTFVKAGETVTVRDRWGREAFAAFEIDGEGTVLAALADERYDFGGYVARGRWSYTVMGIRHAGNDPVTSLVQLVEEMAANDQFQYDYETYFVTRFQPGLFAGHRGYAACYNYWNPGLLSLAGVGHGFGFGYNSRWPFMWESLDPGYDPFWYNPFLAEDLFFDPYNCYGARLIDYAPYYWRPGLPTRKVDRGLKRKKGDIVTVIEPRRRDPDLRPTKTVRVVTSDPGRNLRPRDRGWGRGQDDNASWRQPERRPADRESWTGSRGGRGASEGTSMKPAAKPADPPAHRPVEKPAEKPKN